MRTCLIALLVSIYVTPFLLHAGAFNAGFVQGLWYSEPEVFANTPTRIYVALRNNTEHDLTGTVVFTDNQKRIGSSNVSALPGRLIEAWIDWMPTYGDHTIVATLSNLRLHVIGEGSESIEVESTLAEDTISVDYDTDGDGVGDAQDPDDDNDGVSDIDEIAAGTDPRIVDTKKSSSSGTSEKSPQVSTEASATNVTITEGLERYTNDGTVDSLLTNVTDTINGAKDVVDAYREKRNAEVDEYFASEAEKQSGGAADEVTAGENSSKITQKATITRSQIVKSEPFWKQAVQAGRAILSGIFTLILFLTSNALAHPAILELILLLAILMIVYKLARKLGRRTIRSKS